MDDSASTAWVVSRDNTIRRAVNFRWVSDAPDSLPTIGQIETVHPLTEPGTALAFVGKKIIRFAEGRWLEVDSLPEFPIVTWASPDGQTIWGGSFDGVQMQRREGIWRVDTLPLSVNEGVKLYGPIMMNERGTQGWAASSAGLLLMRPGYAQISFDPGGSVDHFTMSADGTSGWAIVERFDRNASRAVARYGSGRWKVAGSEAAGLQMPDGDSIVGISLDEHGSRGWAVSATGTLVRYTRGAWRQVERVWDHNMGEVAGLWMNRTGTRGVIYGRRGTLLILRNGTWSRDSLRGSIRDALTSENLHAIWMTADGTEGWAVGDYGAAIRYADGRWRQDSIPGAGDQFFRAVAMAPGGTEGWAVGLKGALARREGGRWSQHHLGPGEDSTDLLGVWTSRDGRVAYAVGARATVLHYHHGKWNRVALPAPLVPRGTTRFSQVDVDEGRRRMFIRSREYQLIEVPLTDSLSPLLSAARRLDKSVRVLWFDVSGPSVLKITEPSTVSESPRLFQLEQDRWVQRGQVFEFGSGMTVYSAGIAPDRLRGIAIGGTSITPIAFAVLRQGEWWDSELDRGIYLPMGLAPRAAWVNPQVRHGWVVGQAGQIVRLAPLTIGPVQLLPAGQTRLRELAGQYSLTGVTENGGKIVGIAVGRNGREHFELSAKDSDWDADEHGLTIHKAFAENVAKAFAHDPVVLRITVVFNGMMPSDKGVQLETTVFHVLGRPWWHRALLALVSVLLLNVLLVIFATRSSWLRRLILDPVGSHVVGLVAGKYLVIDALVKYVRPLKLALLRDYRRRLHESPAVAHWEHHLYIPPEIAIGEQLITGAHGENSWRAAFEQITHESGRSLWLVEGVSGLGKTALLEQWTRAALATGATPLLVRLGTTRPPAEEIATLLAQYGDVHVSAAVAAGLVEGGGFIVLLDGFNEDATPEVTRAFVRRVLTRNVVVMASQFDPGLQKDLRVKRIRLEAFGRTQLLCLMERRFVDQALAAPQLSSVLRLPQTAQLAARYVQRNQRLPTLSVYLYKDLRDQLGTESVLLNLDAAAWNLFRTNDILLADNEPLEPAVLELAANLGVLTRSARGGKTRYRFAHERIHRYFVACFLVTQDTRPLAEWHGKLRDGLGRLYWSDVLDIWAELHAAEVIEGTASVVAYQDFLIYVAEFSEPIFRRLYAQAGRLHAAGLLCLDETFVRWAADAMANARAT